MPEEDLQQGAEPDVTAGGATFDIPPDPPADDGGEPAAGPQDQQPAKPSRQARRAERGENYAAAARAADERARRLEESGQATARELAELKGRMAERDRLQQQAAPDPDAAALKAVQRKISNAVARMGQGDTSAEDDWHTAMGEQARIVARQVAREEGGEVEKRVMGRIPAQMEPGIAAIQADYPFLGSNQGATAVANGHVALLVASEQRDMTNPAVRLATLREGAAHAAKVLNLGGGRRQPTNLDRDRIAGASGGDSGGNGNEAVRVHLTQEQEGMAEASFRNLPKDQAHKKWWKEIGSRIQNK